MADASQNTLLMPSRPVLERLARWVIHHRRIVVSAWVVLTIFGAFSAKAGLLLTRAEET